MTCPDPDGVSPFRTHELRPARAPSKPRGQRCSPRPRRLPAGRRPHLSSQSLHPAALPIDRGRITRHSEGSRNSPVRSSPRLWPPGWNGPPLGFPPGFAPRRPGAGRRTPGWGQAIEHGPGLLAQHHISRSAMRYFSRDVRPRVARGVAIVRRQHYLTPGPVAIAITPTSHRGRPL
jgi:hypothetical protein